MSLEDFQKASNFVLLSSIIYIVTLGKEFSGRKDSDSHQILSNPNAPFILLLSIPEYPGWQRSCNFPGKFEPSCYIQAVEGEATLHPVNVINFCLQPLITAFFRQSDYLTSLISLDQQQIFCYSKKI